MPRVEGRELKRPDVQEVYVGDRIILRVDDPARPDFWLTLSYGPLEFGELVARYEEWLTQTDQREALLALVHGIE